MKVRCKQLSSIDQKIYGNWITGGRDYHVLSIFYDERKIFFYRIIGDDGITPALYDSHLFTVVSSVIPENWIIDLSENIFQLSPKTWLVRGFWELYFDGNSDAIKIFEKEKCVIVSYD